MTITICLNNKAELKDLKEYMLDLYRFIEIDKPKLPISITYDETSCTIYMSDNFFIYSYQYFMDILMGIMILDIDDRKRAYMDLILDGYREGCQEQLMSTITIEKEKPAEQMQAVEA